MPWCLQHYLVGQNVLAPRLLNPNATSKFEKVAKVFLGFNLSNRDDFQLILNNRLSALIVTLFVLVLIVLFGHIVAGPISSLSTIIVSLWNQSANDIHSVLINIVSAALYAILFLICVTVFKMIKRLLRRH